MKKEKNKDILALEEKYAFTLLKSSRTLQNKLG